MMTYCHVVFAIFFSWLQATKWKKWVYLATALFDTLGSYDCETTSIHITSHIKTCTESYTTCWDQSVSGLLEISWGIGRFKFG